MDAVMKYIIRGDQQVPGNPEHAENRQEPLGKCGTLLEMVASSPAACPVGFGNPGIVNPSPISLLHSMPCSTMNAVPNTMVASSQFRVQALSPRCAANTPITIVRELESRHAVMIVALIMLSLPNGVGHAV